MNAYDFRILWAADKIGRGTRNVSDVLDPEAIVCNSCGCAVHDDERANQPEEGCGSLTCDCHQQYWDQLDELDKRWLWGDR